jgi:hypothetical protein
MKKIYPRSSLPPLQRGTITDMQLSDHDLKQLDDAYLGRLPMEPLRGLSSKLLADLKEVCERLNQNPSNSSRPPSSQAPWEDGGEPLQDSAEVLCFKVNRNVGERNGNS